jgi:hypothetical protein
VLFLSPATGRVRCAAFLVTKFPVDLFFPKRDVIVQGMPMEVLADDRSLDEIADTLTRHSGGIRLESPETTSLENSLRIHAVWRRAYPELPHEVPARGLEAYPQTYLGVDARVRPGTSPGTLEAELDRETGTTWIRPGLVGSVDCALDETPISRYRWKVQVRRATCLVIYLGTSHLDAFCLILELNESRGPGPVAALKGPSTF